ncbi:hypothetical protein BC937DRAFT_92028 [Endogone sp. FLAS-F59071]|nr:hypothetical protein BC937DRAFT_92028 [Endogone sp. FLAS-F59071]|eukprot:RUS15759.1 hypothetical protein BC937DRAFT_92028 [Endogone sp. FLAS-F59071]
MQLRHKDPCRLSTSTFTAHGMGQPSFCILCKRNNEDGKRHRYTKAHQERVKNVLENQAEQFKKYKPFLFEVATLSSVAAQPVFWCTFCRVEVRPTGADVMAHTRVFAWLATPSSLRVVHFSLKYVLHTLTLVLNFLPNESLHIFEHMATSAHHAKVDIWFEAHRADLKTKKAHVISDKTLEKFHERVKKKEEELDQAEQMERSKKHKEATEASTQEGSAGWQAMPTLDSTGWHDTEGQATTDMNSLAAVTFGSAPSSRALEVNSEEGLESDQTQGTAAQELGPSIQDFLHAKEAGRKRKRNSRSMNSSTFLGSDRASKRVRKWGSGS